MGFGLAPVTLGASLGLSVGGIGLAVLGGGTAAGASIADIAIQTSNVKDAQEHLVHDYDQLNVISALARAIDIEEINDKRQKCSDDSTKEVAKVVGETLFHGISRTGNLSMRLAELGVSSTLEIGAAALKVGGTAARGIAAVGIALNVVLIPIDLAEIIRSSRSLKKGSETKAIEQLNQILDKLKHHKQDVIEVLNDQKQHLGAQLERQSEATREQSEQQNQVTTKRAEGQIGVTNKPGRAAFNWPKLELHHSI